MAGVKIAEKKMSKLSLEKIIANIIINFASKHAKEKKCKIIKLGVSPEDIASLAWMVKLYIIDMTKASTIFDEMVVSHKPPSIIAYELDLYLKKEDSDQIQKWIKEILDDNPKVVSDIKSGKEKAYGFVIGRVMKISKGKADAKTIKEIISEEVNK